MPVFNREQYVKIAIDSILEQSYKNFVFIIYDDGSTDKTIEIIKSYNDKRIILIEGKINKGVAYARNILLKNTHTKYACWQDSDDYSHIDRLKKQYQAIYKKNRLIFTNWKWITYNPKHGWIYKPSPSNVKAFATLMFPVNKTITFREEMKLGGEDWHWLNRMSKIYKESFIISHTLYYIRFHKDRIGHWKDVIRKTFKQLGISMKDMSYKEILDKYNSLIKDNHPKYIEKDNRKNDTI